MHYYIVVYSIISHYHLSAPRQVIWYPGAGAEQIEHAIVKAPL